MGWNQIEVVFFWGGGGNWENFASLMLAFFSSFDWNPLAAVNLLTFLPEISLINIDACTCADGTTIVYLWWFLRTISHLTSESPLIVVLRVSTTSWGYLSHIPVWCQYFFFHFSVSSICSIDFFVLNLFWTVKQTFCLFSPLYGLVFNAFIVISKRYLCEEVF